MTGRVAFIEAYPHMFTGSQRETLLLAEGLRARGWDAHVVTTAPGRYVDEARKRGVPTTVLPIPRSLRIYGGGTKGTKAARAAVALPRVWTQVARQLRASFDIAHIADHRAMLLLGPAARLAGCKVVWHVHGINSSRLLNSVCAPVAHRTIAPSRAVLDRLPGIEWRRPLIEVACAVPAAARPLPSRQPANPPVLITAGRLHPDKGIDVLLRAMRIVHARHPDVRVMVAGDVQEGVEWYGDDVRRLRNELGLEDAVELTGHVDDVENRLLSATVYVQPSREHTELQPVSVLEAMAAGVPVIATSVGAVDEMLGSGTRGVLVTPEAPSALADAIEHVLEDGEVAAERALAAADWVRANCTPERMVDRVVAVYEAL